MGHHHYHHRDPRRRSDSTSSSTIKSVVWMDPSPVPRRRLPTKGLLSNVFPFASPFQSTVSSTTTKTTPSTKNTSTTTARTATSISFLQPPQPPPQQPQITSLVSAILVTVLLRMSRRVFGHSSRKCHPSSPSRGGPGHGGVTLCLRGGGDGNGNGNGDGNGGYSNDDQAYRLGIHSVHVPTDTSTTTTASTTSTTTTKSLSSTTNTGNPLWPRGVADEDVQDLISVCLEDPGLNIRGIPDFLEGQLYKSTIRLTLNAIYQGLGGLHGTAVFGSHSLTLVRDSPYTTPEGKDGFSASTFRRNRSLGTNHPIRKQSRAKLREAMQALQFEQDVEEDILVLVADKLLENDQINRKWLPDGVERLLYINCLKIVFRILNLISASLTLTVCGHDIKVQLEPSTRYAILNEAALRQVEELSENNNNSNINSNVPPKRHSLVQGLKTRLGSTMNTTTNSLNLKALETLARVKGTFPSETESSSVGLDEVVTGDEMQGSRRKRWLSVLPFQRLLVHRELLQALHAGLFNMIVAIVDDLLSHTELDVLSDNIRLDLQPLQQETTTTSPPPPPIAPQQQQQQQLVVVPSNSFEADNDIGTNFVVPPQRSFLRASNVVVLGIGIVTGLVLPKLMEKYLAHRAVSNDDDHQDSSAESRLDFGALIGDWWNRLLRQRQRRQKPATGDGSESSQGSKAGNESTGEWMKDL